LILYIITKWVKKGKLNYSDKRRYQNNYLAIETGSANQLGIKSPCVRLP
jgi:hypothetical protein